MSKKSGDYDIPFDKDGNLMDYPEEWRGITWAKNYQFRDTLRITGFSRGRSSVKIDAERNDGRKLSFFVVDFTWAAMNWTIDFGRIEGVFTFTKKGSNYGCKLVEEECGF